ncbi:MAG: hypothetical protein AB8C46_18295 [Burkholderiaceae bacterium]
MSTVFEDARTFSFTRTQKADEEIQSRTHGVAPRLRSVLIMADGKKPASALLDLALQAGVEAGVIEQLESDGFLARHAIDGDSAQPSGPDLEGARSHMLKALSNGLGFSGRRLSSKVKKAPDLTKLCALYDDFYHAVKPLGPEAAQDARAMARQLLGIEE